MSCLQYCSRCLRCVQNCCTPAKFPPGNDSCCCCSYSSTSLLMKTNSGKLGGLQGGKMNWIFGSPVSWMGFSQSTCQPGTIMSACNKLKSRIVLRATWAQHMLIRITSLLAGTYSSWAGDRKTTTQFRLPERRFSNRQGGEKKRGGLFSCYLKSKPLWYNFSARFTPGKNLVSCTYIKKLFSALCLLHRMYLIFKYWQYFKDIPLSVPLQK